MKKRMNFWFSALMFCTAVGVLWGCADKSAYEPEEQTQKREQFKEKLSHEVTQDEARQNLEKIILDLKIPSTRGGDTNSLPPITSAYTRGKVAVATRAGEEVEPYFHIFNFGDNEGFAIMSGDDRVEPLLALTFEGELTPETEIDNPGFEYAYKRMEEYYVKSVTTQGLTPTFPEIPPKDSMPLIGLPERIEKIETKNYQYMPLGNCQVKWDQEYPYNQYCILPGTNNFADAGCIAVAIAQLMSIYKYPIYYNGYTFDWGDMVLQYPSYEGECQIARLMQQLGLSHNLAMQYGVAPQGSTANGDNIPLTFTNFGYTSGGYDIPYNTTAVVNELKSGYPLLIGGTDGNLGHMWLAHGLMELHTTYNGYNELDELIMTSTSIDYYIQYNWGFKGWCDGYYLSGIFDPYTDPENRYLESTRGIDPDNYQYDVVAYINIRK